MAFSKWDTRNSWLVNSGDRFLSFNSYRNLSVRSLLQELSDDLDFALLSRRHEGCRSIISLLVNVCPRSQQGFGAFKTAPYTRPVECDPAIQILQGQEVDRKRWRREA